MAQFRHHWRRVSPGDAPVSPPSLTYSVLLQSHRGPSTPGDGPLSSSTRGQPKIPPLTYPLPWRKRPPPPPTSDVSYFACFFLNPARTSSIAHTPLAVFPRSTPSDASPAAHPIASGPQFVCTKLRFQKRPDHERSC